VPAVPDILLNNGLTIPQFGFGVFLIEPAGTAVAVGTALEAGYRHVDTAEGYGNEKEVGEAIRKSGLDRSQVFVTSKLANDAHEPDDARRAFAGTLDALGFDYIDLFLIHWPLPTRYNGDFVSTWRTLEEFYRDGRARSIGVSNFTEHHLRRPRWCSAGTSNWVTSCSRSQSVPAASGRTSTSSTSSCPARTWRGSAR
jgi:2,5-diketo-D-gluconate reductase A